MRNTTYIRRLVFGAGLFAAALIAGCAQLTAPDRSAPDRSAPDGASPDGAAQVVEDFKAAAPATAAAPVDDLARERAVSDAAQVIALEMQDIVGQNLFDGTTFRRASATGTRVDVEMRFAFSTRGLPRGAVSRYYGASFANEVRALFCNIDSYRGFIAIGGEINVLMTGTEGREVDDVLVTSCSG